MKDEIAQFDLFLRRRFGKRSTAKHYINDLNLFIKHIGDKLTATISAKDIDSFVEEQVNQGLKATTINRRLAALHSFFEYVASLEPDEACPNPVNWRRHKVKQGHPLPHDVPDQEIDKLFAIVTDERDKAMFGLMVGAGLRVGEVVAIRLVDLEPPALPEQMARLRVRGKGEKERIAWITPYWYGLVSQWLSVRPAAATDHLFLNQQRGALTVRGVQYRLQTYCQQAEVKISPHQLRHTFSRRLAEQRMPIEGISKLLGHAQMETTQRYTAGADPDLRDEFRQAMASVAQASIPDTPLLPAIPIPTPQPETVDPAALESILRRFDPFPTWLRDPLRGYVTYCWRRWQPHLATQHAGRLTRRLAVMWAWLLPERALTDWASLQRTDVEAWLTTRTAAGLSINTLCNDLTALRAFLYFVQEQQPVSLSPNIFRVPYPQRPHPLPRHLSAEQFHQLVQIVNQQTTADTPQNRLDRAWFLMLAHTGVRLCELLNLRLTDIDLASGRVLIRHSKNGYGRLVYATSELTHALLAYLPQRPNLPDNHLWLNQDRPLTDRLVRCRLRRWGQLGGIEVSPHRLRHTLATLLINQGMPVETLRKLLGHRSLSVTQQYAHLSDPVVQQQFQKAIEEIEGIAASEWPSPSSIVKEQTAHKLT